MCPVVSEKKIFEFFSHSKSIETIKLRDLAKFDPRGMNGTIYVEDHYIPNIKAVGLVVSEKKIFLVFPIVGLWRLSTPGDVAKFDPGDMIGTIYVEDH